MSKQDSQSMQSLPVDDVENGITSTPSDGKSVDSGTSESATNTPSDPVSADQNSEAGVSNHVVENQQPPISSSTQTPTSIVEPPSSGASVPVGTQTGAASSSTGGAVAAAGGTTAAAGLSGGVIAAIVVGVLVIVAIGLGVASSVINNQQPSLDNWYDGNASQGQFEGKSKEEIQDALNEEVKKGMMNISIAAVINFPAGSTQGDARIENIAANPMDQKVTIALKDSDEVVYESGAIAPDQHIQTITLTKALAPGDHAAVATFTGYDRETHKETGKAAAEIVLHVEG